MKIITKLALLFTITTLFGCASSSKLIDKGFSNLQNGSHDKAEKKFVKAIEKKTYNDNQIIHKAYHGLSLVETRRNNLVRAEDFEYKAYQNDKSNPEYAYNIAKFKANSNDRSAYNWLFSIGESEVQGRGSVLAYGNKASNEPMFKPIANEIKFQRFCAGFRRVKLSIDRGYSSESDKWTENDQFATVAAIIPSGEKKVVLATNTIENENNASWYNQYAVFDYKLGTTVNISQLDEDFTSHDLLSQYNGVIPWDLKLSEIKGQQSRLAISLSDTEQQPYTSGTSIPSTISPGLIGAALTGATYVLGLKKCNGFGR
jgi:hypothetical protein